MLRLPSFITAPFRFCPCLPSFPFFGVLCLPAKSTGNMKDHTLAALAVALVCLVSVSTALSFDSSPNQIKCFREQLSRHQVVSGEVGGTSSPFQTLKFWVCVD